MSAPIDPAWWVEVINKGTLAIVAFVAMIVGSILQWLIAKRIAADNVSAKRQIWIDELRKDMSEFLTVMARLNELNRPNKDISPADAAKNFEDIAQYNFRGTELGIRIKLRLNPKEEEHNQLVSLLESLSETPEQKEKAKKDFYDDRDKVVAHMQTILKLEWERVKKGIV